MTSQAYAWQASAPVPPPSTLFRLPLSTQSHSGVLESAVLLLDPDIAWLLDPDIAWLFDLG